VPVAPPDDRAAGYGAVLRSPVAARLLAAKAVAELGDFVGIAALLLLAYDDTGSVIGPATVYAARTLPALLVATVFSGWLDVPPRRTTLVALSLTAAVLLVVPIGLPQHGAAVVAAGLLGAVRAAYRSVHTAVVAESVDRSARLPLFGLTAFAYQVGQIGGLLTGASLTLAVGPGPALVANAATYLTTAAILFGLPESARRRRERPPATAGLRIIWQQPVLRVLTAVVLATMLSSSLTETLATDLASGAWLPVVMAGSAVGGAVFALVASGWRFLGEVRIQLAVALGLGLALVLAAGVVAAGYTSWQLAVANALIGAGGGWLIGVQATFADLAPAQRMGQVEATMVAANIVASGVGVLSLGWLAATVGPAAAYLAGGVAVLAAVASAWRLGRNDR
jgi:hypothetical protein